MKGARRWVFGTTVVGWLLLCWTFWRQLVRQAATSGDLYARTPSFQLINFAVQYLWAFLLLLMVVLLVEWAALWIIGHILGRGRRTRGQPIT